MTSLRLPFLNSYNPRRAQKIVVIRFGVTYGVVGFSVRDKRVWPVQAVLAE